MGLEVKLIELRDKGTFIPLLCVRLWRERAGDPRAIGLCSPPESHWLIGAAGYGPEPLVMITHLNGGHKAEYDPYAWGGRTYPVAHLYIQDHWDNIPDGGIVDVRVILGETTEMPESERKFYGD